MRGIGRVVAGVLLAGAVAGAAAFAHLLGSVPAASVLGRHASAGARLAADRPGGPVDPGPPGPERGDRPADRDPGGRRVCHAREAGRAPAPHAFRGPRRRRSPGSCRPGPVPGSLPSRPQRSPSRRLRSPRRPRPSRRSLPPPRPPSPQLRRRPQLAGRELTKAVPAVVTAAPKTTDDKNHTSRFHHVASERHDGNGNKGSDDSSPTVLAAVAVPAPQQPVAAPQPVVAVPLPSVSPPSPVVTAHVGGDDQSPSWHGHDTSDHFGGSGSYDSH